jgi:hypothetical protein
MQMKLLVQESMHAASLVDTEILRPIVEELKHLETNGIMLGNEMYDVRVFLLSYGF